MTKFVGVEPSGSLNVIKFRYICTGVNALLLILGQPVKYQITNESRSSVMGVDECPIPKHKLTNTKYEPRIRNHYLRPPYFFLCHCEGLSPEAISLFIVNTGDCHASINRGSQ